MCTLYMASSLRPCARARLYRQSRRLWVKQLCIVYHRLPLLRLQFFDWLQFPFFEFGLEISLKYASPDIVTNSLINNKNKTVQVGSGGDASDLCLVRISAGTPTIPTPIFFCGFPQSLQANARIVPSVSFHGLSNSLFPTIIRRHITWVDTAVKWDEYIISFAPSRCHTVAVMSIFAGLPPFRLIPVPYSSRPETFRGEPVGKSKRNFTMFRLMYLTHFF
jgi:hypothetical protein